MPRMSAPFHPVLLSGGSGTRLWPLSRKLLPKQFLPLTGETSLFQQTLARLKGMPGAAPPVIVANDEHRFLAAEQLRALGVQAQAIILEAAALHVVQAHGDGVLFVLPTDHVILDLAAFQAAAAVAIAFAARGELVTFGIPPRTAATGYGYIELGDALEGAHRIARFVEKPD